MQKYPESVTRASFLENMEPVVRSVCAHIGIAFDPGMLNYYQQKAEFKTRSENINTKRKCPQEDCGKMARFAFTRHRGYRLSDQRHRPTPGLSGQQCGDRHFKT